jgi:hypothetical protein
LLTLKGARASENETRLVKPDGVGGEQRSGVRPVRQNTFCRVAGKLSVAYIKRMIRRTADVEKNAN